MKKKEYISPVFTVINLNSKRYFLLGSNLTSKKLSIYKPNSSDPLEDVEDGDGELD
jgi:hypothetical protein